MHDDNCDFGGQINDEERGACCCWRNDEADSDEEYSEVESEEVEGAAQRLL